MPFELGLFVGAKEYGTEDQKKKICLITDTEKYRFQKFLSDIGGQDIQAHKGNPKEAISLLCKWLRTASKRENIPGGEEVNKRYNLFKEYLPGLCSQYKIKKDEMVFFDYCTFISAWLKLGDQQTIR